MKEELEICLKANVPFETLIEKMINLGFRMQEDFQMNDTYMIKESQKISLDQVNIIFSDYILVREVLNKNVSLVRKKKDFDNKGNILKQANIKCKIDSKIDGYNFLSSIGYKKIFELKDHNILMSNGQNEIYIQDVENLGVYVEMEQKNLLLNHTNGDSIEQLVNNLKKYNLPLDYTNHFTKKAFDMLEKVVQVK